MAEVARQHHAKELHSSLRRTEDRTARVLPISNEMVRDVLLKDFRDTELFEDDAFISMLAQRANEHGLPIELLTDALRDLDKQVTLEAETEALQDQDKRVQNVRHAKDHAIHDFKSGNIRRGLAATYTALTRLAISGWKEAARDVGLGLATDIRKNKVATRKQTAYMKQAMESVLARAINKNRLETYLRAGGPGLRLAVERFQKGNLSLTEFTSNPELLNGIDSLINATDIDTLREYVIDAGPPAEVIDFSTYTDQEADGIKHAIKGHWRFLLRDQIVTLATERSQAVVSSDDYEPDVPGKMGTAKSIVRRTALSGTLWTVGLRVGGKLAIGGALGATVLTGGTGIAIAAGLGVVTGAVRAYINSEKRARRTRVDASIGTKKYNVDVNGEIHMLVESAIEIEQKLKVAIQQASRQQQEVSRTWAAFQRSRQQAEITRGRGEIPAPDDTGDTYMQARKVMQQTMLGLYSILSDAHTRLARSRSLTSNRQDFISFGYHDRAQAITEFASKLEAGLAVVSTYVESLEPGIPSQFMIEEMKRIDKKNDEVVNVLQATMSRVVNQDRGKKIIKGALVGGAVAGAVSFAMDGLFGGNPDAPADIEPLEPTSSGTIIPLNSEIQAWAGSGYVSLEPADADSGIVRQFIKLPTDIDLSKVAFVPNPDGSQINIVEAATGKSLHYINVELEEVTPNDMVVDDPQMMVNLAPDTSPRFTIGGVQYAAALQEDSGTIEIFKQLPDNKLEHLFTTGSIYPEQVLDDPEKFAGINRLLLVVSDDDPTKVTIFSAINGQPVASFNITEQIPEPPSVAPPVEAPPAPPVEAPAPVEPVEAAQPPAEQPPVQAPPVEAPAEPGSAEIPPAPAAPAAQLPDAPAPPAPEAQTPAPPTSSSAPAEAAPAPAEQPTKLPPVTPRDLEQPTKLPPVRPQELEKPTELPKNGSSTEGATGQAPAQILPGSKILEQAFAQADTKAALEAIGVKADAVTVDDTGFHVSVEGNAYLSATEGWRQARLELLLEAKRQGLINPTEKPIEVLSRIEQATNLALNEKGPHLDRAAALQRAFDMDIKAVRSGVMPYVTGEKGAGVDARWEAIVGKVAQLPKQVAAIESTSAGDVPGVDVGSATGKLEFVNPADLSPTERAMGASLLEYLPISSAHAEPLPGGLEYNNLTVTPIDLQTVLRPVGERYIDAGLSSGGGDFITTQVASTILEQATSSDKLSKVKPRPTPELDPVSQLPAPELDPVTQLPDSRKTEYGKVYIDAPTFGDPVEAMLAFEEYQAIQSIEPDISDLEYNVDRIIRAVDRSSQPSDIDQAQRWSERDVRNSYTNVFKAFERIRGSSRTYDSTKIPGVSKTIGEVKKAAANRIMLAGTRFGYTLLRRSERFAQDLQIDIRQLNSEVATVLADRSIDDQTCLDRLRILHARLRNDYRFILGGITEDLERIYEDPSPVVAVDFEAVSVGIYSDVSREYNDLDTHISRKIADVQAALRSQAGPAVGPLPWGPLPTSATAGGPRPVASPPVGPLPLGPLPGPTQPLPPPTVVPAPPLAPIATPSVTPAPVNRPPDATPPAPASVEAPKPVEALNNERLMPGDVRTLVYDNNIYSDPKEVPEHEREMHVEGLSSLTHARSDYGGEGSKYNAANEDSALAGVSEDGDDFVLVIDGAGGSADGLLASQVANREAASVLRQPKTSPGESRMLAALKRANDKIVQDAYGTYATAAGFALERDGDKLTAEIGWVGDAAILIIRNGLIIFASKSDNLVQRHIDNGRVQPHEYYNHRQNNVITKSLGHPGEEPNSARVVVQEGDLVICGSDGALRDCVSDYEVAELAAQHKDNPRALQKALFELAYDRANAKLKNDPILRLQHDANTEVMLTKSGFGNGDNITVSVSQIRKRPPEVAPVAAASVEVKAPEAQEIAIDGISLLRSYRPATTELVLADNQIVNVRVPGADEPKFRRGPSPHLVSFRYDDSREPVRVVPKEIQIEQNGAKITLETLYIGSGNEIVTVATPAEFVREFERLKQSIGVVRRMGASVDASAPVDATSAPAAPEAAPATPVAVEAAPADPVAEQARLLERALYDVETMFTKPFRDTLQKAMETANLDNAKQQEICAYALSEARATVAKLLGPADVTGRRLNYLLGLRTIDDIVIQQAIEGAIEDIVKLKPPFLVERDLLVEDTLGNLSDEVRRVLGEEFSDTLTNSILEQVPLGADQEVIETFNVKALLNFVSRWAELRRNRDSAVKAVMDLTGNELLAAFGWHNGVDTLNLEAVTKTARRAVDGLQPVFEIAALAANRNADPTTEPGGATEAAPESPEAVAKREYEAMLQEFEGPAGRIAKLIALREAATANELKATGDQTRAEHEAARRAGFALKQAFAEAESRVKHYQGLPAEIKTVKVGDKRKTIKTEAEAHWKQLHKKDTGELTLIQSAIEAWSTARVEQFSRALQDDLSAPDVDVIDRIALVANADSKFREMYKQLEDDLELLTRYPRSTVAALEARATLLQGPVAIAAANADVDPRRWEAQMRAVQAAFGSDDIGRNFLQTFATQIANGTPAEQFKVYGRLLDQKTRTQTPEAALKQMKLVGDTGEISAEGVGDFLQTALRERSPAEEEVEKLYKTVVARFGGYMRDRVQDAITGMPIERQTQLLTTLVGSVEQQYQAARAAHRTMLQSEPHNLRAAALDGAMRSRESIDAIRQAVLTPLRLALSNGGPARPNMYIVVERLLADTPAERLFDDLIDIEKVGRDIDARLDTVRMQFGPRMSQIVDEALRPMNLPDQLKFLDVLLESVRDDYERLLATNGGNAEEARNILMRERNLTNERNLPIQENLVVVVDRLVAGTTGAELYAGLTIETRSADPARVERNLRGRYKLVEVRLGTNMRDGLADDLKDIEPTRQLELLNVLLDSTRERFDALVVEHQGNERNARMALLQELHLATDRGVIPNNLQEVSTRLQAGATGAALYEGLTTEVAVDPAKLERNRDKRLRIVEVRFGARMSRGLAGDLAPLPLEEQVGLLNVLLDSVRDRFDALVEENGGNERTARDVLMRELRLTNERDNPISENMQIVSERLRAGTTGAELYTGLVVEERAPDPARLERDLRKRLRLVEVRLGSNMRDGLADDLKDIEPSRQIELLNVLLDSTRERFDALVSAYSGDEQHARASLLQELSLATDRGVLLPNNMQEVANRLRAGRTGSELYEGLVAELQRDPVLLERDRDKRLRIVEVRFGPRMRRGLTEDLAGEPMERQVTLLNTLLDSTRERFDALVEANGGDERIARDVLMRELHLTNERGNPISENLQTVAERLRAGTVGAELYNGLTAEKAQDEGQLEQDRERLFKVVAWRFGGRMRDILRDGIAAESMSRQVQVTTVLLDAVRERFATLEQAQVGPEEKPTREHSHAARDIMMRQLNLTNLRDNPINQNIEEVVRRLLADVTGDALFDGLTVGGGPRGGGDSGGTGGGGRESRRDEPRQDRPAPEPTRDTRPPRGETRVLTGDDYTAVGARLDYMLADVQNTPTYGYLVAERIADRAVLDRLHSELNLGGKLLWQALQPFHEALVSFPETQAALVSRFHLDQPANVRELAAEMRGTHVTPARIRMILLSFENPVGVGQTPTDGGSGGSGDSAGGPTLGTPDTVPTGSPSSVGAGVEAGPSGPSVVTVESSGLEIPRLGRVEEIAEDVYAALRSLDIYRERVQIGRDRFPATIEENQGLIQGLWTNITNELQRVLTANPDEPMVDYAERLIASIEDLQRMAGPIQNQHEEFAGALRRKAQGIDDAFRGMDETTDQMRRAAIILEEATEQLSQFLRELQDHATEAERFLDQPAANAVEPAGPIPVDLPPAPGEEMDEEVDEAEGAKEDDGEVLDAAELEAERLPRLERFQHLFGQASRKDFEELVNALEERDKDRNMANAVIMVVLENVERDLEAAGGVDVHTTQTARRQALDLGAGKKIDSEKLLALVNAAIKELVPSGSEASEEDGDFGDDEPGDEAPPAPTPPVTPAPEAAPPEAGPVEAQSQEAPQPEPSAVEAPAREAAPRTPEPESAESLRLRGITDGVVAYNLLSDIDRAGRPVAAETRAIVLERAIAGFRDLPGNNMVVVEDIITRAVAEGTVPNLRAIVNRELPEQGGKGDIISDLARNDFKMADMKLRCRELVGLDTKVMRQVLDHRERSGSASSVFGAQWSPEVKSAVGIATEGLHRGTTLYEVLGVGRDASGEEIKKAFRQKAKDSHPDTHLGDPVAEAQFKRVTAAWDILGDDTKRSNYDAGMRSSGGRFGGLSLDELFGLRPGSGSGGSDPFVDIFGTKGSGGSRGGGGSGSSGGRP